MASVGHLLRDERARTDRSAKEGDALLNKVGKQGLQDEELAYVAQQQRALELRMREDEVHGHRNEIARINGQVLIS
ncbi:hypothetical protein T492DRAFT_893804 [Pavlovales sp. CCMP2436]|nr:hypothetical protein T492DRAFT_893804 [Pavlovales sp. CCMP2436]